jgi:hypothetical protein
MPARFCPSGEQRRTVEAMVSYGIPQVDIARVVGIDDDTLRKHFREEIDTGVARANTRVAQYLFEQATGQRGDSGAAVTAAIFWAKTRMRWKETLVNEHTGAVGVGQASPEERAAAARKLIDETFAEISRGGNDGDR